VAKSMLWNKIPEAKAPDATEGRVLNNYPLRDLFAVILVVLRSATIRPERLRTIDAGYRDCDQKAGGAMVDVFHAEMSSNALTTTSPVRGKTRARHARQQFFREAPKLCTPNAFVTR
jgi:hypothetical protein